MKTPRFVSLSGRMRPLTWNSCVPGKSPKQGDKDFWVQDYDRTQRVERQIPLQEGEVFWPTGQIKELTCDCGYGGCEEPMAVAGPEDFLVITRHEALVEYLQERGMIPPGVRVIDHAEPEDIQGKHVIGVLPMTLAKFAATVTVVPLNLPRELRGKELTLEQVREFAGEPETLTIRVAGKATQFKVDLG